MARKLTLQENVQLRAQIHKAYNTARKNLEDSDMMIHVKCLGFNQLARDYDWLLGFLDENTKGFLPCLQSVTK